MKFKGFTPTVIASKAKQSLFRLNFPPPRHPELVSGSKNHSTLSPRKFAAFTLAETLITLAIIGVIAALVIPLCVQNYKEKETVTRVKKFYRDFSQAFQLAILENGQLNEWGYKNSKLTLDETYRDGGFHDEATLEQDYKFYKTICQYMNCSKLEEFSIDPETNTITGGVTLADGTMFVNVWLGRVENCDEDKSCGDIGILTNQDVLKLKKEEEQSKYRFNFTIYSNRIEPSGKTDEKFQECLDGNYRLCTFWVIKNGNLDYLRCKNLDINKDRGCKK